MPRCSHGGTSLNKQTVQEKALADFEPAAIEQAPGPDVRVRWRAKNFFWTFPHLGIEPKTAIEKVKQFKPVKWVMVAHERHKDGEPHIHVAVEFCKKLDIIGNKKFDKIFGKHGNYQVMKNPIGSVKYLMKDGNYECYGIDPVKYVAANKSVIKQAADGKWDQLYAHVAAGLDLFEFPHLGFLARNLKQIQHFRSQYMARKPVHRVGDWREVGIKALVLWGKTGAGKSHWARRSQVAAFGEPFVLPFQRDGGVWWDGYSGEKLLVLDDFDPSKMPLLQLLRVLDPYKFVGMVKGSHVVADWLVVIITNNIHPDRWYPNAYPARQRALMRRLRICEFDESMRNYNFDVLCTCPARNPATDNVSANLVDWDNVKIHMIEQ